MPDDVTGIVNRLRSHIRAQIGCEIKLAGPCGHGHAEDGHYAAKEQIASSPPSLNGTAQWQRERSSCHYDMLPRSKWRGKTMSITPQPFALQPIPLFCVDQHRGQFVRA